jgi:hypothetical protein
MGLRICRPNACTWERLMTALTLGWGIGNAYSRSQSIPSRAYVSQPIRRSGRLRSTEPLGRPPRTPRSAERSAIGVAQPQARGLHVLLQVSERGRAGDRQHHG